MASILSIESFHATAGTAIGVREKPCITATVPIAFVLSALIFVRTPLLDAMDIGFGDRGDGIIEISLLEHWRNVLLGYSSWNTTFFFFPHPNTLGYNDGYFLYGIIYTFWRMFLDSFHADTMNIVTFKMIGYFSTYLLVSKTLRWNRVLAVLTAVLFTFASNIALQAVHAQLQSIGLLPLYFMLAISMIRHMERGHTYKANLYAAILSLLVSAWLMTSYYMAWFTIFSSCLFMVCWLAVSDQYRPANIIRLARRNAIVICSGLAGFSISVSPFLMTYLPKLKETGGEDYYEMLGYLVTPLVDMINVGPDNYVWGWIFRPMIHVIGIAFPDDPALPGRVIRGEHSSGFPILFFILVVVSLWRIIVRRVDASGEAVSPELRAFAMAMAIAWLLTLQFWVASPWGLIFEFVPGAKGLRVVSRYQLWLTLPFLLIVAAAWRGRMATIVKTSPVLAAVIASCLVIENLSAETAAQLPGNAQRTALFSIPPPPRGCSSFYIKASRVGERMYINPYMNERYPHNVDAMLLAELWRIPTLNGFSTFNPPDWNFRDPTDGTYDARVSSYVVHHHLKNVCRLDVRQKQPWTKPDGSRIAT